MRDQQQEWSGLIFMQGIITDLRAADLISNEEYSHLGFKAVHFLKETPYNLKPLVTPVCALPSCLHFVSTTVT